MSKYRNALPQLSGKRFLTDSGFETTLIFRDGIDLPYFASFILLKDEKGRRMTREYYEDHARMAIRHRLGFLLEAPTWRAHHDWAEKLDLTPAETAALNRQAIAMMAAIRDDLETAESPMAISGCIGPRGDGYDPGERMSADQAQAYHAAQIHTFADTAADLVSAFTLNYVEEAIGITRAAQVAEIPVVISFTVETDGRLPTGQSLKEAIETVDRETGNGPVYYMLNCAHPTHFADALANDEPWLKRLRGLRANASRLSHAELDQAEVLDDGNPEELGRQYGDLIAQLPHLSVLGGCCGTDHRHVEQIGRACTGYGHFPAVAA